MIKPSDSPTSEDTTSREEELPSFEEFSQLFLQEFGTPKLSTIADENQLLTETFKQFHPVKAASTFAGLLLKKQLQSNCLRLEVLIHLALTFCEGSKSPPAQFICHAFKAIGDGTCGQLEDPAEDVFVSIVYSSRGNYRILEGIWESSGFFLQRFLNIVERLPDTGNLDRFKNSIHALLKLSDSLCERANLARYDLGEPLSDVDLPRKVAAKLADARRIVRFTREDIFRANIEIKDLAPFVFNPRNREALLDQKITNTDLERRPISLDGDDLVFLLPTAVSAAIRRFVVEVLGAGPNREQLLRALTSEYSRTLSETPLFGDTRSGPVIFTSTTAGILSSTVLKVDVGRYLCLVFFLDTLDGFDEDKFTGTYRTLADMADAIDSHVASATEAAQCNPDFINGIVLLVGCGVGRGASIALNERNRPGWRFDSISAPDLCTLSWTPQMKPLNLWRIYAAKDKLSGRGIELQNANGLLNLFAWSRSLEGHLVPHASIPIEMVLGGGTVMITQNALLELRHEVAIAWDTHAEQDEDGHWNLVRKEGPPHYFKEDGRHPIYATIGGKWARHPRGLCISNRRTWWFELVPNEAMPGSVSYERWKMLGTWIRRAAVALDRHFLSLPHGPILWRCNFAVPEEAQYLDMKVGTAEDACSAVKWTVNHASRIISFEVSQGFNRALFNSENVAEAALISALVHGVAELAGIARSSYDHAGLTAGIVASPEARQTHIFVARSYLDYMEALADTRPITINKYDDAELKLGLGWRIRDPADGPEIEGKAACNTFLNCLVADLEEELCSAVRQYGRRSLIEALLFNCESANWHRAHWKKTASAVLALREEKEATLHSMGRHEFKLNGVLQASRILMEMAICESPQDGKLAPGNLDLSRLMACAATLFHLGGWSDAIRWDAMEPTLIVRPLGDVHANKDFIDNIAEKFADAASAVRFRHAAESYAKNLEERPFSTETADDMEGVFLSAWVSEFGANLHEFRRFIDELEDFGIREQKPVLYVPRSRLVELIQDHNAGDAIVRTLTLQPRASWRNIPEGYDDKDRQPWRFRRQLSVVRRPMLQINCEADPMVLVAPGMVRESFAYTVSNYHDGNFPDWQLGPAMRSFVGHSRRKRGHDFNIAVAERLKQLGWQVEHELELTKLFGRNLGRNWGDVDVFAWNSSIQRILVIECKDVHFRKTYGEMAEQLSDFRGDIRSNGKPDMLRKHLNRIDQVRENLEAVRKFTQMPLATSIESHLVFKNPVPMLYAARHIEKQVRVSAFDALHQI